MDVYGALNQALQDVGAAMDVSETHGVLCGLICFFDDNDKIPSILSQQVLGDAAIHDQLSEQSFVQLSALTEKTIADLDNPDCLFQPLLPNSDKPLSERIQAIGGWCEGFLYGVGLAVANQEIAENAQELLNDLAKIARIAPIEDAQTTNDDEKDYAELVEYIRIGTLNLYEQKRDG
jgi:yecA family protein